MELSDSQYADWDHVGAIFDAKAASWEGKGDCMTVSGSDCPLDNAVIDRVRPRITVVDVGGGNGKALRKLAPLCSGGTLVLVDRSPRMVDAACLGWPDEPGPRRVFTVGDGIRLPLPSESADIVLLRQLLQHVPHPLTIVKEAARLVRHGGQVIVQVPGPAYLASWVPFKTHEGDCIGRFGEAELEAIFASVGLKPQISNHQFDWDSPAHWRHCASLAW